MNRNNVKIKICGLSREEDITVANELSLDYIGFVFAKKSKRYVSPEQAASLKAKLDPKIRVVGVFVNEDPNLVASLVNKRVIDIAQLHGSEDAEYIGKLQELIKNDDVSDRSKISKQDTIWQAFRIDTAEDIKQANASVADMILLDHGAGGTGEAFDWSLLKGISRRYMLAGGLTPENATLALAQTCPSDMIYGLDISSGVETDGRKDPEKMRLFSDNVRSFEKD